MRMDGVAVLQTFEDPEVQIGDSVVVAGCGHGFNGTHTIISTQPYRFIGLSTEGDLEFDFDEYLGFQVLFFDADGDDEREPADGTLTYTQSVSWIVAADVTSWLGIDVATANDTAFVGVCVNASNAWCYRKRREAGYIDSMTTVPSADVKLGTVMYAATLYRERGSVDSFASFDSMAIGASPSATLGRIMQLLGCGRAQVA
jgi:hypothetical protein